MYIWRLISAAVVGALSLPAAQPPSGNVWAWGDNQWGQLGNGTTTGSFVPIAVSGLSNVVAIAAGGAHALALLSDGTVRAWGMNEFGQLGNGTTTTSSVPVTVSGLSNVVAIAAGSWQSYALLSDGTVRAWGDNSIGLLGNGTYGGYSSTPVVSGLSGVVAIAAGLALLSDGTVRAWSYPFGPTPVPVSGLSGIVGIGGSRYVVLSDGTIRAWGSNVYGELGNGSHDLFIWTPVTVSGLSGAVAVTVSDTTPAFALALLSNGTVWGWGFNGDYQLGDNPYGTYWTPVIIDGLSDIVAISAAAGGRHSLAIRSDGTLWAWGINFSGQLGIGTTPSDSPPIQVGGLSEVIAIGAGGAFSLALVPPPASIGSLIQSVNTLVSQGALNPGQGNSLIAKLQSALRVMDGGKSTAARNVLGAFINEVNALVNSGRVAQAEGQGFINAANDVIAQTP